MDIEYTLEQAESIKRMLHNIFITGYCHGILKKYSSKELLEQADKEVELAIKQERLHNER